MPKKKATADVDENIVADTLFITNELLEGDEVCRQIVQECSHSAIELVHQQIEDAKERQKAATDILDGFIYFSKWCYMNKDVGEQDLASWTQEAVPSQIAADSWSSNIIPIRKIKQKKEDLANLEMKTSSKTNSVRSGQSNRSKSSLRHKPRRASIEDMTLKKPLTNIMDEASEHPDEDGAAQKVEIIQLEQDDRNPVNKSAQRKSRKLSKGNKERKTSIAETENKENEFSINIKDALLEKDNSHKKQRHPMHIGLKTGRLSMNASNVYKYHPNKPFTYDHTGQKMSVIHMKPEKIPDNKVSPVIVIEDNSENSADHLLDSNSKSKSRLSGSQTNGRKKRKRNPLKSNGSSDHQSRMQTVCFKTNSVPVQPPIESVMKVQSGVLLKTKKATIKGSEKKKDKIENLSRSEYNQYIESLKYMAQQTQIFDTAKTSEEARHSAHVQTPKAAESETENTARSPRSNTVEARPVTTQQTADSVHYRSAKSPINKSRRMQQSPTSMKQKRGATRPESKRLISDYNRSLLVLPKIETHTKMSSAGKRVSDRNDSTLMRQGDRQNAKKRNEYQRQFVTQSPKSKIEKSKLGKSLFGST